MTGGPGPDATPAASAGTLVRSRVDGTLATPLVAALERELTGYGICRPQATLLLEAGEPTRFVFEAGAPIAAGRPDGSRRGATAVLDLVGAGPYRMDLYAVPDATDSPPADWAIDPGLPANAVADDPSLADRCRAAAPTAHADATESEPDPVESFLRDADRIAAIQEQARADAERRAAEWGFEDALE